MEDTKKILYKALNNPKAVKQAAIEGAQDQNRQLTPNTTNTVGSVEEIAKGFESWDSFYSGLTIEQETEQDSIKLYEQYLIEYIKDALDTVQQQAKAEERERIIELVQSNKDAYMIPATEARFIRDVYALNQDTNQT